MTGYEYHNVIIMQVAETIARQIVSQCYNGICKGLRSHSRLHALGIILSISGIFRFYLDFQPLASLFLLLFNWIICIVLESMAVEILFQISWRQLKFQNVTLLRRFVMVLIFTMGLINIYSMWQLMREVRDCVAYKEYNWMIVAPPMWLTMSTAMLHTLILAICVPVQVIIVPLECNRNIPNINFRSRNITLAVNLWLFVHFVYLSINYSYYNTVSLLYRLFCTVWMFLYCHPQWIQTTYHWFKQQLPDQIRPFLRSVRDNQLVIKVWRNLRAVIEQRRREGNMVDDYTSFLNRLRSLWNVISDMLITLLNMNSLWRVLYRNTKFWLPYVIICVLVSCLRKYIGCEFTLVLLTAMVLPIHMLISYLYQYNHETTIATSSEKCTDEVEYNTVHSTLVVRAMNSTSYKKCNTDHSTLVVGTMNSMSNEYKKYDTDQSELIVGINTQVLTDELEDLMQ